MVTVVFDVELPGHETKRPNPVSSTDTPGDSPDSAAVADTSGAVERGLAWRLSAVPLACRVA